MLAPTRVPPFRGNSRHVQTCVTHSSRGLKRPFLNRRTPLTRGEGWKTITNSGKRDLIRKVLWKNKVWGQKKSLTVPAVQAGGFNQLFHPLFSSYYHFNLWSYTIPSQMWSFLSFSWCIRLVSSQRKLLPFIISRTPRSQITKPLKRYKKLLQELLP
jgi:hypothetical protein